MQTTNIDAGAPATRRIRQILRQLSYLTRWKVWNRPDNPSRDYAVGPNSVKWRVMNVTVAIGLLVG